MSPCQSFISMYLLHCVFCLLSCDPFRYVPAYSLTVPSSPANENANSLLINYPGSGVNIPKGREWGKGKQSCSCSIFHLMIILLSNKVANPNCGRWTRTICIPNFIFNPFSLQMKSVFHKCHTWSALLLKYLSWHKIFFPGNQYQFNSLIYIHKLRCASYYISTGSWIKTDQHNSSTLSMKIAIM